MGVVHDLDHILDNPSLQRLTDTHFPSPAATVVLSKAQMLHVRAQGMADQLDKQVLELRDRMDSQREAIIADLEELEAWLGHTYSYVLLEPNRYLYNEGLVDEESLRVRSEDSSTFDEGEAWQQRRVSDASGGSAEVGGGVARGGRGEDEDGKEEVEEEGGMARGGRGEDEDGKEEAEEGGGGGVAGEGGEEEEEEIGDEEFTVEFSISQREEEEEEEEEEEGVAGREEVPSPTSTHTETITSGEGSSDQSKSRSDETGMFVWFSL